jgi:hypothetical protein
MRRWFVGLVAVATPALVLAATQGGPLGVPLPLFPATHWWNVDVSSAPLDPASAAYVAFIGGTRTLHPDFGGEVSPGSVETYGMPYAVVDGAQAKKAVWFDYWDESDGGFPAGGPSIPFYPIPDEAITQAHWIEGGQPGNQDPGGDRHMLIVDRTNNHLYELYALRYAGGRWNAGSGAFFDMNTSNRRPEGWTSADAAGLAILPGLVRHDEACGTAEIAHAFRVTVRATNGHVYPASHTAGSTAGALPMGARLRLKASTDISEARFSDPCVRRVFRAMKKHGLIVADNGSDMYVSGTFDLQWPARFDAGFHPQFKTLRASDFEVVQLGWVGVPELRVTSPNGGEGWPLGSRQQVRWTAQAIGTSSTVRVSLVNGASTTVLATVPSTQTSLAWTVSGSTTTSARVRVECVGCASAVQDESDATFSIVAAAAPPPVPSDFNADGRPDLLWHHQVGGDLYTWLLSGTVTSSGAYLDPPRFADTRWQIRGLADFNADGKVDVLWHHQATGDLYVWYLNGTAVTGGAFLTPRSFSDTRWQIRGVTDFDKDGKPDILWHHQVSGELYVWFLNGLTVATGSYLDPRSFSDTRWQIRGVADLNRDGQPDLLWHHQGTGDLYVWFLNGLKVSWGSYLDPPRFADTRWQIRRVMDLNDDGQPDVLWHHQTSGDLYVWFLDGVAVSGGTYLTPSRFADTRWQIVPR